MQTIDQDKGTVTFDIGPNGSTAKAQLTGAATIYEPYDPGINQA